MDWIVALTFIAELAIGIALFIIVGWIKKLPDAIHKRSEQAFQHQLNQKLEAFKNELTRELELLKISHAELQVRKTEEFISFANLQREFLTDKSLLKKIEDGDTETASKIQNEILKLATGLFFFASDETVRKYGHWKSDSIKGDIKGIDLLREYGNLMVALRKDLGYKDTQLTSGDYLRLFVNDWHKYEDENQD